MLDRIELDFDSNIFMYANHGQITTNDVQICSLETNHS